jgi:hypothetical protein
MSAGDPNERDGGAAARNDARPILGVVLERGALEWIDVVADETDDAHGPYARCLHPIDGSFTVEP